MTEEIKYGVEDYMIEGLGFEYRYKLPGDEKWRVSFRDRRFTEEKMVELKMRAEAELVAKKCKHSGLL